MAGYPNASEEKKYMAEMDLKTLIEAGRIKKDAKRYKAAMACHAEQMKMMAMMENGGKKA
jgi:two-component SAPR family response regulator